MRITKNSNPIGLPAWPDVDDTQLGEIIVSAKVKDPDVLEARAQKIGLVVVVTTFLITPLLTNLADKVKLNELLQDISVKKIGLLLVIGFGGVFGFMFMWQLATALVGRAVNLCFLFWLRSSVVIRFTSDSVEIVHPRRRSRWFDRKKKKIEFHVVPHPFQAAAARDASDTQGGGSLLGTSARFLDAFRVNLVYGGEVVCLLSTHDQDSANDFVTCLKWAAAPDRSEDKPPASSSYGTTAIAVDDKD